MIEVKNLEKHFGSVEVLKDISIHINDGEIYGIIGHSGAGKSTLLRCLNGLETYQSGSANVLGCEVSSLKGQQLRDFQKKIGMIFQNFNLMSRADVYDNVALPLQFCGIKKNSPEAKEKILKLLELVGIADKIHERPSNLSGGQKQRVAIARALVLDPKILLCDEATSALDPQTTGGILNLLLKINAELGITIVVVTHQMEVVKQICSRVAFIKGGNIVAEGKPEELFILPNPSIRDFLGRTPDVLPTTGNNVQLFFADENSGLPIITRLARTLDLDLSIVWGKIENFRNEAMGSLVINVEDKDLEAVENFLKENNVKWEVMEKAGK